jgi:hypothetical protein
MAVQEAPGTSKQCPGVVVLLEHVEQDGCELHTEYGVFCDDSVKAMKLAGENAQFAGVREGGGSVGEAW